MRADTIRWFGEEVHDNPGIQILGLVGESGEVADCYKKYLRGSKDLAATKVHMAEELIDVFYYWVHLVELVGVDVFKEYIRKRDKNEGRFAKHD
jgi:NTP pyrophosphatase (non-canonical NTP hydrolase)